MCFFFNTQIKHSYKPTCFKYTVLILTNLRRHLLLHPPLRERIIEITHHCWDRSGWIFCSIFLFLVVCNIECEWKGYIADLIHHHRINRAVNPFYHFPPIDQGITCCVFHRKVSINKRASCLLIIKPSWLSKAYSLFTSFVWPQWSP